MNWFKKLQATLNKVSLDKLSDDELSGQMGSPLPGQDPSAGAAQDPSANMPPDASTMGIPPGMAPMDPSMLMPPEPPPEALVWNNKYLVKTDGPEFIVELKPNLVMNDPLANVPMPTNDMQQATAEPMDDKTLNPNADSKELADWLEKQDNFKEKPYSTNEKATVDPLSKRQDGLPISDTGNEQKIKVHKKADQQTTPGAERSNAYYPCSVCANYNVNDDTCSQGLDVEKVQAAKSCSWLNSNFHPFGEADSDPNAHEDKEIVKSNIDDLSQNSNSPTKAANKNLKDKLQKLW